MTAISAGGSDFSAPRLFGDYAVTDAPTIGAQVLNADIGGSDNTVYGVSAEYGFGSGGFAQIGAVGTGDSGGSEYNASVGLRF